MSLSVLKSLSAPNLSSLVPGGLWSRLFCHRRHGLDLLPIDVLVDEIISRLDLKSILALQRVNKNFYLLTRQPAVWKRFIPYLSGMGYPLAAMPPSNKYSKDPLTALEIQNIVTRAISLDNNWRGMTPTPFNTSSYETYHRISSMVLLPGGHYMVASVQDLAKNYAVMVWAMEHPSVDGCAVPLAIRYTEVKAYHLQAKYMTIGGRKGIAIAFLRKRHKDQRDEREIPESLEMGGPAEPEDPDMPLKYECTTLHITLDALDILTDRRLTPETPDYDQVAQAQKGAIRVVSRIRTGSQIGALTLEEVDGQPLVAVVKRPNRILIENLTTNKRTTMECARSPWYPNLHHSIWNIKFIATQCNILVIRTVERPQNKLCSPHTFELYHIPEIGLQPHVVAHAVDLKVIAHHGFVNIQVADLRSAPQNDESLWPLFSSSCPPPPISIYCRKDADPEGLVHLCIWPAPRELPQTPPQTPHAAAPPRTKTAERRKRAPFYYYGMATLRYQRTYKMTAKEGFSWGSPRVLPGASRAIVYSIPRGWRSTAPPVGTMLAYQSPEIGRSITRTGRFDEGEEEDARHSGDAREGGGGVGGHGDDESEVPVWPVPRKEIRKRGLVPVVVHPYFAEHVKKGMSAIAWDEGIGRVCVATAQDRQLHVMDFAFIRHEDDYDMELNNLRDRPLDIEASLSGCDMASDHNGESTLDGFGGNATIEIDS